jgi:branched-chain amino acid aminotransferase
LDLRYFMQREPLIYLDGKFVPKSEAKISVFDHGLLYGDGVFEGIRAFDGQVFKLREHTDRLFDSARSIELDIPMSKDEMNETVLETLRKNNLSTAYIRLVVTRGEGDMGVNPALCRKSTTFVIAQEAAGLAKDPRVLSTVIASVRRDGVDATSHEIKSLNYLNSVLAVIEANRAKVDYPIMLDHRGFVSEGSTMNIFAVKNGDIVTPAASAGILRGVTRERVMGLCKELKYSVTERDVTPFEVITADEVFFTGTLLGLAAVGEINGKKIGSGAAGPTTKELYEHFKEIVSRPEEGSPIFKQVKASPVRKK